MLTDLLKKERSIINPLLIFIKNHLIFWYLCRKMKQNLIIASRFLNFLEQTKKNAFIFTHDFRVSLIPLKYRPHVIEYNVGDTNRLNLASKKLTDKLMQQQYHAVIDLNIKDNIFYSHLISILDLQVKIGFKKNNSDNYYNIQVNNVESNPEKSYKNLVNCLQMF